MELEVVGVDKVEKGGEGRWKVTMRDWRHGRNGGGAILENWDAVAVANGWYDNTACPDTQGL